MSWSFASAQNQPAGSCCPPSWAVKIADGDENTSPAKPKIQWMTDHDKAVEAARESKKVLLIDFYADWCKWCKVLDQETFVDPKIVALANDRLIALKIDTMAEPKLAEKYGASALPLILFLSPEGKTVHKINGFKPPKQFLPEMTAAAEGKTPKKYFEELLKKGTEGVEDPNQQVWVASKLVEERKLDEALTWLNKAMGQLTEEEKIEPLLIVSLIHIESGRKQQAIETFDVLSRNPKVDPESLAEWEVGFAEAIGDTERMMAALDRLIEFARDESKKRQIRLVQEEMKRRMESAPPPTGGGSSDAFRAPQNSTRPSGQ